MSSTVVPPLGPEVRSEPAEPAFLPRPATGPALFLPDCEDKDTLGRAGAAAHLAGLLAHPQAGTPFLIGITGSAGSGKSSFLGLMLDRLDQPARRQAIRLAAGPDQHRPGGRLIGGRGRLGRALAAPHGARRHLSASGRGGRLCGSRSAQAGPRGRRTAERRAPATRQRTPEPPGPRRTAGPPCRHGAVQLSGIADRSLRAPEPEPDRRAAAELRHSVRRSGGHVQGSGARGVRKRYRWLAHGAGHAGALGLSGPGDADRPGDPAADRGLGQRGLGRQPGHLARLAAQLRRQDGRPQRLGPGACRLAGPDEPCGVRASLLDDPRRHR